MSKEKKTSTHPLNLHTKASIEHLNVRKTGDDNDDLAVDIKLNGFIEIELISALMGVESGELSHSLWHITEKDQPSKFIGLEDMSSWAVFEDIEVSIAGILFSNAKLHKFKFRPVGELKADCTFTVSIGDCVSEKEIGTLAAQLKQVCGIKARKNQQELPLDPAA